MLPFFDRKIMFLLPKGLFAGVDSLNNLYIVLFLRIMEDDFFYIIVRKLLTNACLRVCVCVGEASVAHD